MSRPTGIPTLYKGIQFRSRLESRWAVMFDLMGWEYQYEPFDLAGWIPDFLLPKARVLVEVKPVTERPDDVIQKIERAVAASADVAAPYEALILGCVAPIRPDYWGHVSWCGDTWEIKAAPFSPSWDGEPIGWMWAKPPAWQPDFGRCWGTGIVQTFRCPDPAEIRDSLGLLHSLDGLMRDKWPEMPSGNKWRPSMPPQGKTIEIDSANRFGWGDIPMSGSVRGFKDIRNSDGRLVSLEETSRIVDLWNAAGNLVQWKGPQSITE